MERLIKFLVVALLVGVIFGCGAKKSANIKDETASKATKKEAEKTAEKPQDAPIIIKPMEPTAKNVTPKITNKTITAMSRKTWSAQTAQVLRMTRMKNCNKITVHHEGGAKPNYDVTVAAVSATLRKIQSGHNQRMNAGDIGYHFIIDRQGRIWQGRDLQFQGAHVKAHNPHNIGIMCLGNFELQKPTAAQVETLTRLCSALMQGYKITPNNVFAHRDLGNSLCPGKFLYPYVVSIRKSGTMRKI